MCSYVAISGIVQVPAFVILPSLCPLLNVVRASGVIFRPASKVVHVQVLRVNVSVAIRANLYLNINLLDRLINGVTRKSASNVSSEFVSVQRCSDGIFQRSFGCCLELSGRKTGGIGLDFPT